MNETLKAAGHIGAELGAAIAENERLRGLLRDTASVAITMLYDSHKADVLSEFKVPELEVVVKASEHLQALSVEKVYRRAWDAALSLQAEPVEPAPAQDERCTDAGHDEWVGDNWPCPTCTAAEHYKATRPAQTEQKPSPERPTITGELREFLHTQAARQNLELETDRDIWKAEAERLGAEVDRLTAPIAQTAPQPERD
ncbi:hypothetical protein MT1_3780 [Pseudomonas sp. MT-1]|uniref:hypothetical protein n=1 Tax=Stutzerimonas stutzeri TaxID=316 RepID=UPI000535B44C|nr:hypothetical protein [Stutzerimonas stutzeri]MCQ4282602.1 hypothetical protein [Stutzerimonas stutzeri]BAP80955.1 hypothetical protein MT1_3780 [Pseudomonas sp. MT-1]